MKPRSKLSQEQQQSEQQSAAEETRPQSQEFATAEEMVRFDAKQTEVPPQIAERLKQSIAHIAPPPRRSWWQNLFGQ
ncbi:MAG TPA: hypothetical protein VL970_06705 [Candidatus Acidoferrales bacterium]|nr:hypothetical protein [Candidatus Acidoferrales bacterium]